MVYFWHPRWTVTAGKKPFKIKKARAYLQIWSRHAHRTQLLHALAALASLLVWVACSCSNHRCASDPTTERLGVFPADTVESQSGRRESCSVPPVARRLSRNQTPPTFSLASFSPRAAICDSERRWRRQWLTRVSPNKRNLTPLRWDVTVLQWWAWKRGVATPI